MFILVDFGSEWMRVRLSIVYRYCIGGSGVVLVGHTSLLVLRDWSRGLEVCSSCFYVYCIVCLSRCRSAAELRLVAACVVLTD